MTDQKITMTIIYERKNRNRHYQIVKENRWLQTGRIFTGLALYKKIIECGRLDLVAKTEREDRDDVKNIERNMKIEDAVKQEILDCVAVGVDKTIVARYDSGEIKKTSAWEYEI